MRGLGVLAATLLVVLASAGVSAQMPTEHKGTISKIDAPPGPLVRARVTGANPCFPVGTELRGHEFHYSRVVNLGPARFAYRLERGQGVADGRDGLVVGNVLAAYTHLHAAGTAGWAESLVAQARAHQARRPAREAR